MLYLTADEIRDCHNQILESTLEVFERRRGTISETERLQNTPGEFEGKLDSIMYFFLNPPDKNYSPCTRISRFIYEICSLHPFIEANKRTAYFVSITLLELNGYHLKATHEEIFDFLIEVSKGNYNVKQIDKWLRKKCRIKWSVALLITFIRILYIVGRDMGDIEWHRIDVNKRTVIRRTQFFVEFIESKH